MSMEWKYLGPGASPVSILVHVLLPTSSAHISLVRRLVWTYLPPKTNTVGGRSVRGERVTEGPYHQLESEI